jgi:hypothetical protein
MAIKEGTYIAKVLTHAISETQKGDPQAVVTFSFQTDDGPHNLNWYGSFSEKAMPHTVKALVVCGLKGNNPAGELEIGKEVQIVIENEADDKGVLRSKIRWVNQVGGGVKKMAPELARAKLSALEGAVMAARQKLGASAQADEDTIPF